MTVDLAVQPIDAGGLRFTHEPDMRWIQKVIDDRRPNLVVLDSLRIMSSGTKESDGDEMEPVITAIKQLARDTGAAIILIHHRGKGESAYRGSSVILDQTDMMFALGRVEGDPEAGTRRKLETVGCRLAEEPPPRWIEIRGVGDDRVHVGEAEPFEGESRKPRDAIRDHVLSVLDGTPRSGRSIAKAVCGNPENGTIPRVLKDLAADGLAARMVEGWVSVDGASGVEAGVA